MSPSDDGLIRDWTYSPSPVAPRLALSRLLRMTMLRRPAPPHRVLTAAVPATRWSVYFAFLPDGRAADYHRFTLARLAAEPGRLLGVVASPTAEAVPVEFRDACDALIWKGLGGFDFSAYALALRHLAEASPGADLFVMNDSVFGPFASPAQTLADAPWDLAGFTASSLFENHVQSYAFQLRAASPARITALALPRRTAFDRYMDVVICQETRLARHAARTMSVGARWFAPHERVRNLSLERGVEMSGRGVPFVKRSLLARYADLQDRNAVLALLETHGHPL